MFRLAFIILYFCYDISIFAQNDSLKSTQVEEVIINSSKSISDKESKPLSNLDNYLEKISTVNMVRRGSYAWEPFINGMASERNVVTIDGMRIYGACTDKMDPVTSYVEISNLSKASVHSGQSSSSGATIGGSLDLERKKGTFSEKDFKGSVFAGLESNNLHKIVGSAFSFSHPRFYSDVNFTLRDAENYKSGGNKEVLYSQFTKYNASAILGFKIGQHRQMEASVIYDHAVDVGYPALPMDVSTAKAFIGSLEYTQHHISSKIHQWQTKIYYNDVTHIMDDTKRPIVPIRMDMPGWSKTAGFYSYLQGIFGKHHWKVNLSGHHNRSLAEMTMYSNNPNEKDMFMLTWPNVLINYGDVFIENKFIINEKWKSNLSVGSAIHNNIVDSKFGLEGLKIFYPDIQKVKSRFLQRTSASVDYKLKHWLLNFGLAYGERAPSVSEAYGFYLFNSFDRFDYIGNPNLKNEKSASATIAVNYFLPKLSIKLSSNVFYISNYIIGKPHIELSAMTIGSAGVKVYEALDYAQLFNSSFDINYQIFENLTWSGKLSYRSGTGKNVKNLPLIQPFTYNSNLSFSRNVLSADISIQGALRHNRINPDFGEQELPAYFVTNISGSYRFIIKVQSILLKAGIENILDRNYTTFADWNRLPRMGRNFFLQVIWKF